MKNKSPHDRFLASLGALILSALIFLWLAAAPVGAVSGASLSGRILLDVERHGESWYVWPENKRRYYLGRPADAFRIMRELGLGISRENLAKIHKPDKPKSVDRYSRSERINISTANGTFTVDLIIIDTNDPDLRIITAAASAQACEHHCPAVSLGALAVAHDALAAINGTYFDTSAAKKNYSFSPVYDYPTRTLVNENQLKYWTTGPLMTWDEQNNFLYFKDAREFPFAGWRRENDGPAIDAFAGQTGKKITALIGNKPRLIEDKMNLLIDWDIDDKQKNVKSIRNGLAVKGREIYLIAAQAATVPDLALIMQALGVEDGLNLDGGYSAALWYDGEYLVGPGRDIVNGILFIKK